MGHSTDKNNKEDEYSDWFSDHSANNDSRESTTSCDSMLSSSDDNSSSTKKLGWLMRKTTLDSQIAVSDQKNESSHSHVEAVNGGYTDQLLKKKVTKASEKEMLKEHFTKLLLCEDMSGHGNGVCTALTISNAITNLCANVFGQLWRLEPLTPDKKSTWKREMEWLLSVCNHIVEFAPTWQTSADGTTNEVMSCRPRSDLYVNLPALRKLDNMLLDILNGFGNNTEFWYVDKGAISPSPPESDRRKSVSAPKSILRVRDKWWLPVPRVPIGGLKKHTIKAFTHRRDCANQIHKAAKAINTMTLAEMEVPESYLNNLPKNVRSCLGDVIYSNMASEHFTPECLLDCLDLSSDHVALEIANRVDTAIYILRKRHNQQVVMKSPSNHRTNKGRSWGIVRDHHHKEDFLAHRAESLLLCLRQRFPSLSQTTLDESKIQFNKDIGKAILESYSRVLSSLALSITARIEDVLYVDEITKQSDKISSMKKLGLTPCRKVSIPHRVPVSGANSTPVRTTTTPSNYRSPVPLSFMSPVSGAKTPCGNKISRRGMGVRRVLASYVGGDVKAKSGCGNVDDVSDRTIVGRRLF